MYDVIVIGGGPAGMTAALYAKRAGKSVMMLESDAFGGQIATAPRVENFPSVNEIAGARLADNMFEQVLSHGVEFDMGRASVERQSAVYSQDGILFVFRQGGGVGYGRIAQEARCAVGRKTCRKGDMLLRGMRRRVL